jgi:hypothetical protein
VSASIRERLRLLGHHATLDRHGQPLNRALNADRRCDRAINELLGMVKGILLDGEVNDKEIHGIELWLDDNAEAAILWPIDVLLRRINHIYEDGRVDDQERAELKDLLEQIVGGAPLEMGQRHSTALPLTKPEPDVIFDQNVFVLTGKFWYGTRKDCEREIQWRGGRCASEVTLQTSYLVIGGLASVDWLYTTHGRKIEKAVEYAGKCPLAIVSEEWWSRFLMDVQAGTATV